MSFWDDILSQPENLRHVIEAHAHADQHPLEGAARLASGCSRIIFTGVGSGLNATIPAVYYLMSRGRAAEYIDATELVYNLYPGVTGSLLVLNTRSGETAEVIRAAELAKRAGVPTVAVTNEPASTVARLADACLPTYSRWDDLVVISAYGGMLVSELVLAGYLEGQLDSLFSELKDAPQAVEATIKESIAQQRLDELDGITIINPEESVDYAKYVARLWELRQRHGLTFEEARRRMRSRAYYAAMMLEQNAVDGPVSGLTTGYADAVRPALEVIGTRTGKRAAGVYIVVTKNDFKFFADCTVNIEPTAEELAEIAINTSELARYFEVTPRVAMLSYSTFGSAGGSSPARMREATQLVRQRRPDLEVDGEIQVDIATCADVRVPEFPFSTLKDDANVLVFPNLDAANISYNLLKTAAGNNVAIGPILLGAAKPVHILTPSATVRRIVNMTAITVADANAFRL